ncbi:PDZ domain-containing protein [Cryobacterium sp. TMT1-3]|uniref:PDZ domain-containing protein n=1 Tax=Cryobacterium luteum TaxID=1424661 RepID=A0A1H8E2L7_9MICO|nr:MULTISPECIES: S16 family serine protease [Cryobacterium]TFB89794.1 PDZ domain-containing protein [Cryobacterium luteum]TFC25508.1 PDZ domain-containing protein [Cryobacterium sp. TMT1-3]SEN13819.1 PDZ domain-containing protein [Cryobacterium luteum]
MALFTDDSPASQGARRGRPSIGWTALLIALVAGVILGIMPAPYVIEQPGPVYNTLGSATDADDVETALITIPDETTYPTGGRLDLLTVSLLGNRENRPSWLSVARAWLDPSEAVLPIDQVFPANVSTEQRDARASADMINSQQDAIAAALTHLGYDYPTTVSVVSLPDGSPAKGVIEPEDQISAVNGTSVANVAELRAALQTNGAETAARLDIVRGGAAQTVEVTPIDNDGTIVAGVNVTVAYDFPFDVQIQLDKVGGPSAGMMFALGIIDKLTPGELQGGENVAGTGTIDQSGAIGPIGGIQQKLFGAVENDATWFLAPADNCDEVTGNIPDGLTVFSVATLDEALTVLDAIKTGADTSALPSCPAG